MKDIVTAAARIAKKRLGMINLLAKVYIRESDEENHGDLNAIERDFIEQIDHQMGQKQRKGAYRRV